ncbi:MAG: arginine--tRNA ligase [Myxococcales bacterium]|nr:arginine--tRNA ligase [Myxococcales bacterium]
MIDPSLALAAVVRKATIDALGADFADVDPAVRRSDRADFQADLAMGLARRAKMAPRPIAEAIVAKIEQGDLVEKVEVAGPGFLNFTLRGSWLAEAATAALADERSGATRSEAPETIVIDYSSPNVAKEMHVGHLRSTVIGDSLARVLQFRGHEVIRQNHLGDWGTPFGMLIEHLLDVGAERAEEDLAVGELGAFYKAARAKFDADPAFTERSRRRVVSLQSGDAETLDRWRMLVEVSKKYFDSVYRKLGITMKAEDACGESFYDRRLAPLAGELEGSGKATISDGALCLFPAGFQNKEGQPLPMIVRKSDGGFGYAATDLAAIRYRLGDLGANRVLYVVGAPQSQHFAMLFEAAKALGWLAAPRRAEHVAFGSVLGTDKRMFKTRSGDTVRLVDLVDAAVERADAVIGEKNPDLEPAVRSEVARKVGVGAIKYADLSSDRIKDYVFDLERMVSFEGNTAGYAQYAYARARSIFRKAEGAKPGAIQVTEPAERALVLELLAFGGVVKLVEETLEPHRLAGYVYAVALAFTAFYEKCPILKSDVDPATRASRLALVELGSKVIARALDLLGIEVPERM